MRWAFAGFLACLVTPVAAMASCGHAVSHCDGAAVIRPLTVQPAHPAVASSPHRAVAVAQAPAAAPHYVTLRSDTVFALNGGVGGVVNTLDGGRAVGIVVGARPGFGFSGGRFAARRGAVGRAGIARGGFGFRGR